MILPSPTLAEKMDPPAPLNQHQWRLLLAIADGLVGTSSSQPIDSKANPLDQNPSELPAFITLLQSSISHTLARKAVSDIQLFLTLIGGYGAYLFNGTNKNLYDLTRDEVENVFIGWQGSRLAPVRMGAKGIGFIIRAIWMRTCPGIEKAMGFPGHVDPAQPDPLTGTFDDATTSTVESEQVKELTTGILVLGSGSGASAFVSSVARNLNPQTITSFPANRSSDILILEKGSTSNHQSENGAINQLWEGGGIFSSDEGVSILAGSTWGGGSRINWSACLQTDRKVRDEWTREVMKGLGKEGDPHGQMFLGEEWQECMEQ